MKTAEEKAEEFIRGVSDLPIEDLVEVMRVRLGKLLKEQDRDTRHACAEAVNSCESEIDEDGGAELVCVADAHNAIMNTKAV